MRTFGAATLVFEDGANWWELVVEPHVAIRAKRIFGRLHRAAASKLRLRAIPETSRDLAWLESRFHLEISPADRVFLEDQASTYDRTIDSVHDILSGKVLPRKVELALPLRNYQAVAVEAAMRRGGLLLADDVGLGKTAVAIGLIAAAEAQRPALVVTLTHLTRQWQREFERFAPGLRTHVAKTGTAYPLVAKKGSRRGPGRLGDVPPDVLIMNYHKVAGWADALAGKIKTVVLDECQELRRTGSDKYYGCKLVAEKAELRLGMSATPIYNYGGEFHHVLECVLPGALGTWGEFTTEWCTAHGIRDQMSVNNPQAFGSYLREGGMMLRRRREDVGREIAALSVSAHYVDADTSVLLNDQSTLADLCRIILGSGEREKGERMRAGGELDWRLRQWTGLAKAPYVAKFVDLLVEGGEQVVLYGWHHAVYDVWAKLLAHHRPTFFTGEQSETQKAQAFSSFVEGDSRVLVMSLRAGAGLDGLQKACSTVVFGELDWSPGVHTQAIGRIHRDGQARPVVAYYLVSEEGSDPVIADVLDLKTEQLERARDPDAPLAQPRETFDRAHRLAERYAAEHGLELSPPAEAEA